MTLPYQIFIALRYLRSRKKNTGISFTTVISIGGVAVGVMALLTVLSVMSGFHEDIQKKILGANAHVITLSVSGKISDYAVIADRLRREPEVQELAPFVMGQVLVSTGQNAHGVFMKGIDLIEERKTTDILNRIKYGSIDGLTYDADAPWIIIGSELSGMLGVVAGESITIISPKGELGPLGMIPKFKKFRIAAVFDVGMFEYDANLVLTDLRSSQDFFGLGTSVTGVEIKLKDLYAAPQFREAMNKSLPSPFFMKDWMQMNRNLFSALKLEKFAMFVILILIVLVASFNIVSTLMMNVMEKQKEIAILKSMGATNEGIMAIFMLQGLVIGVVGTTIGVVGGSILCYVLNTYEIIKLPPEVYYLRTLPVKVNLFDFALVSLSAVAISFLSTIYPSYHAARLNPVEPLRYE
jgi:lipoprotein-releasing system permease protein